MKAFHHLTLFILIFALNALATPSAFDQKFNSLQKGMTTQQVKVLVGAPDLREVKADIETWHYNSGGGRVIVFDKNAVSEFGRETSAGAASGATVEPLERDLDVGQACKEDAQCKSQNCHFHTCSGKNNCTVPVGKLCAVDSDCCDSRCDFGKCKKR